MAGAAASFLLLMSGSALAYLNLEFGKIKRFDLAIDVPPAEGEPRNYLLVGSDSRGGLDPDDPFEQQFFDEAGRAGTEGVQRTDTIMILRVDPEQEAAYLLSLPRDLWVPISDTGSRSRINVAFSRGREVLVDTIRENFGIPIHHYVEIDFVGFFGLVDAIGGVPMYFSEPVRDDYSQLHVEEPGCVVLDGPQALAFARARHLEIQDPDTGRWRADPTGDFGRISRQQEFIRKAISKAVSRGLSNPVTLNDLVQVGVDYVGLDPTLKVRDILSLGKRFANFDSDNLKTYSVPASNFRTSGGASVLDLDEREAEPIFNVFRGLDPDAVTPAVVRVSVLNGTGEDGLATDVTTALDFVGFSTGEPGDTVEPQSVSTLFYSRGNEEAAKLVARYLTSPVRFATDANLGPAEVVLVAGSDFTTVHDQISPTIPEIPTTTTTTSASAVTTTTLLPTTTTTEPLGYVPDAGAAGAACG